MSDTFWQDCIEVWDWLLDRLGVEVTTVETPLTQAALGAEKELAELQERVLLKRMAIHRLREQAAMEQLRKNQED